MPVSQVSHSPIPTDDPEAALQFCRALARCLSSPVSHDSEEIELSIVLPVYNEKDTIGVLVDELSKVLAPICKNFELVFVDDGSSDGSETILDGIAERYSCVVVAHLARNFGQQAAFTAGMMLARGKAVVLMDSDLQDDPRAISLFLEKWRQGYDVVYAIREARKESLAKRAAYAGFYRLLRLIADVDIPLDSGDFSLISRRVVDTINSMPERSRFVRGIRSWAGHRQIGIPIERRERTKGEPKYTFKRLANLALDGLVSFSFAPLRAINILGLLVSLFAICLAIFYAIKRLLVGLNPPGFATTVVLILFFSGVQLITLGVIGEYLGRVLIEVRSRPMYLVSRIVRRNS